MNQHVEDAKRKMDKTIESFRQEIAKIRTGKATTALLDGVKVDYYGTPTALNQVANVSVLDAHTLNVTPWEKSLVGAIEKAIMIADLGLNPSNDGNNIRVPIPPLNEERRKEMVKLVKKFGEESKVALRNIRRDAIEHLKKQEKNKEINEDTRHDLENQTQKLTDDHSKKIDELIKHKEEDIMKV